jgi:hypothetical protein
MPKGTWLLRQMEGCSVIDPIQKPQDKPNRDSGFAVYCYEAK